MISERYGGHLTRPSKDTSVVSDATMERKPISKGATLNAKEFHEHYGVAIVKQLLERIDVGRIYWNTVKNGNRPVSLRQAFKLAKASSELVPAGEPHMTVLDLMGIGGESPKLIGVARGTNPPGVSNIAEPRVSAAKIAARARPKCSACGQQCKHTHAGEKEAA